MAAQDAELKLKVSLDLAFFRQQLAGLGAATAGTPLKVQVQFDRRSVQNELNALSANIRRRNYTLNVNTNLKAEIDNAAKLAKALADLEQASKKVGGISKKMAPSGMAGAVINDKTSYKQLQALYKFAKEAQLPFEQLARGAASSVAELRRVLSAGFGEIGDDVKAGISASLNDATSTLAQLGKDMGETLLKETKRSLGIASPSREFKKIGQNVGEGLQQGMMSSMDKAFDAVEGLMRARMKVLDTIARGMFRMAGIDPAAIRAEAAQRRALPGVNFPATVPPRNISIGPSGTGRALPPGAIPSALPGTAFGAQRYLPTALSDELKQILRGAAFAFVDSLKQQIRSVGVGLSATQQPLLGASRIAGLLPAGVGRAPSVYSTGAVGGETRAEMMARREREARMRSALRGMDVMGGGAGRPPSPYSYAYRSARPTSAIVPYGAPGAIVPQPAIAGGAGGGMQPPGGGGSRGGAGGFGRAMGGLPNLPGSGVIRDLGSEFAFAAKQVLLFGQAYKLLGILQDFPAQVGAAVGQLQSFRNTLNTIAPTAGEVRASNELILDLMNRYNVPLQSARDGFTKLYASMAPAGFSGDEIRELFTGITKAAATFGMSADKVDRVNYAFAQMASKGQIMSEELKGQLGDVLPGAMALFAEAAGFEGPKAIQDFSAALEDGAYKGQAMVALLKNVGIVMNKEFGPGAEGAARTFQGVINRMQNSMTLLYESFEPIAVGFLNTVVTPMTDGIKQLADGLNAFFAGEEAKTAGGGAIAQQLNQLKPSFDGIAENLQRLKPLFDTLTQVAGQLGKIFIQLAGNPFTGYLLRTYLAVLPLVTAIKILNLQAIIPMIASLVRAIPAFVAFNAAKLRLIGTNKALQLAMQLTGNTSTVTAGKIRLVTAALATLAAPAILLGIGALIERFMMLQGAVDGVRQSTQQMVQSISSMANAGLVKDLRNVAATTQQQISTFEGLSPFVSGGAVGPKQKLTPQAAAKMQEVGLGSFVSKDIFGKPYVNDFVNASKIIEERLKGLRKQSASVQEKLPLAEKVAADLAGQAQQAQEMQSIATEGTGGTGRERESQVPLLQLQLATTEQIFEIERQIMTAKLGENELEVIRLEGLKEQLRINEEIAKVRLNNDLPAQEKALQIQKLMKDAELARLQTNFDTEMKILEVFKKVQDKVVEIGREAANELSDKREYERLVTEGVLPSVAKITVEVNRQFAVEAEKIKLLEAQIDDQIELLEAEKEQTKNKAQLLKIETQLAFLRGKKALVADMAGGLPEVAERTIQSRVQAGEGKSAYASIKEEAEELEKQLKELVSTQGLVKFSANAIGEAFASSFKDAITGAATAQEALAGFFQSVGNAFADMAAQMIQKMIQMYILNQFLNILPGAGGMFSGDASIKGGGFGDFAPGADPSFSVGGVPDLPGLGGAGGLGTGGGAPVPSYGGKKFANGGIAYGGFKAFANGGMVTGPTLGLVGEGKYNEAVVPLPDGKTIPVDLGGAAGNQIVSNITVNVNNGQTQSNANGSNSSELGRKLEGAVKQVIVGELRPGGLLAR